MADLSTPDPNVEFTGNGSEPPPSPRKGDTTKLPGDDRVTKNLGPSLSDAASSSESDPVTRERTLVELHRQVAFLQSEIIRRQAEKPRKQPASSTKKPASENLEGFKPKEKTDVNLRDTMFPPNDEFEDTEVPSSTPRKTPLVRKKIESDYEEEEGDSDYRPPKRFQQEDMREFIRKEMAEAKRQETRDDPSDFSFSLSPLSSAILGVRFPKKFVPPNFERYDGSTDPVEHLRHFQDVTAIYSYDDALLCRMFPSSLKGTASRWFYSLKPESLYTFKQVVQVFVTQYSSFQAQKKNRNHLFTIKMSSAESLKDYLTRFQTERALIHDCSDDVASAAFVNGLSVEHKFYSALTKQSVTEMKDILRLAPGFIQLEEARKDLRSHKAADKPKFEAHTAPNNRGP